MICVFCQDEITYTFENAVTGYGQTSDGKLAETIQTGRMFYLGRSLCRKVFATYLKLKSLGREPEWITYVNSRTSLSVKEGEYLRDLVNDEWEALGKPTTNKVFADEICAWDITEMSTSNCGGDSGAPLFSLEGSSDMTTFSLTGITAGTLVGGCKSYLPVIYASVPFYREWIQAVNACWMNGVIAEWEEFGQHAQLLQDRHEMWYMSMYYISSFVLF